MNNIQNMLSGFQQFMNNPSALSRMGIPQGMVNNPNEAIQYLMNSGRISQAQFNQARQMAEQIKNNPLFNQMMNR